ncbi:MAG: glycosyl hydrolase family 16 [Bacteroidetes bacterium]|nr:MAG: glycosyl hydrolase family 16 [Bacteroidota bacterium]
MKTNYINNLIGTAIAALMVFSVGCERPIDGLEPAQFPVEPNVFIDGFSAGLEYAAFGGSDVSAFEVVDEGAYKGTSVMRFAVPDFDNASGAYAGGAFFVPGGRDLSGFNVLTFWAKASKSANIDILGFGNDLGENRFVTTITNTPVTTNWQKYYIPIPDPSKLTQEKGMFYYSEGPEDGRGYTFWIDEVKFENLGTIAPRGGGIFNGVDSTVTAESGAEFAANAYGLFNLPNGVDMRVEASAAFFEFFSSNPSVASVDANGLVTVGDEGEATITATLAGRAATGSLAVTSTGAPVVPRVAAPTPTEDPADVISIYSNAYTNEPIDFLNGYWEFSTTLSEEIQIAGDDVVRYSQLNFVGIQFTAPTIDISDMTRFHMDIWTPDQTAGASFKILLVDIGPDGTFGGNDDSSHEITLSSPTLQSETWLSIDLPLTSFPGLTGRGNLAQIVLSGDLPNVYVDNIYFYDDGQGGGGPAGGAPEAAAPTPTLPAADVISLFSDAYTDVPVDVFITGWSEASLADTTIAGNAAKIYSDLNFVGIETIANQIDATGMSHFHIDMWTPNATSFGIKLVDAGANGVIEGAGSDDVEHQIDFIAPNQGEWISYDIPLSDFTGLTTRANLAQYILVGQPSGTSKIYIDNMYFHK